MREELHTHQVLTIFGSARYGLVGFLVEECCKDSLDTLLSFFSPLQKQINFSMIFVSLTLSLSPSLFPSLSLTEPVFIQIQYIPDSAERNDDKLYFFFREKTMETGGGTSPSVLSRVGRVCLVRTEKTDAQPFC